MQPSRIMEFTSLCAAMQRRSSRFAAQARLSAICQTTVQPQGKFPGTGPRAYRIRNTVRENRGPAVGKGPGGGRLGGRARLLKGGPPSKVFLPQSPLPHPARFARRQSPSTSADAAMAGIHQNFFIFFSFPFFVRAIRIYAIRVVRNCLRDFRFSGRRSGYRASACAWRTAW